MVYTIAFGDVGTTGFDADRNRMVEITAVIQRYGVEKCQ